MVAAAFAYFSDMSAGLANNVAVNVTALEGGDSVFSSNATQLNLQVSAALMERSNNSTTNAVAENTATLFVNLISGDDNQYVSCTYDIVYEYDYNSNVYGDGTTYVTKDGDTGETASKEITMVIDGPNVGTNNYNEEKNFNYDSTWTAKDTTNLIGAKRVLVSNAIIGNMSSTTQTTQNWTFTGRYYNLNTFQSQLAEKAFIGKIYVENKKCDILTIDTGNAGRKIISNNNLDLENSLKSGMRVNEDDFGTSYYFRGAVDNNWLKFGEVGGKPIYWRIIRINGDGSIRIIYTGTTAPTESQKVVMTGYNTQITTSKFNADDSKPEYVGYKYEIGKQHGLANDSIIKTKLESWYESTTLNTDSKTSKLVADVPFCYDRSLKYEVSNWSPTSSSIYYYGSYGRIESSNDMIGFKCPNKIDLFSVNANSGNGTLTYPVGLITADEVIYCGGNRYSGDNDSYYLYTGSSYWTGTPSKFYSSSSSNFSVFDSGTLVEGSSVEFSGHSIRPVINLSKDANLSGDGTWNNPYTVDLS